MKRNDGSLQLGGHVTPLMELFSRRRSVRKYEKGDATPEQLAYIEQAVAQFLQSTGFAAPRIVIVSDETEFHKVVSAALSGVVGKTNPWLKFTKARQLMLCCAVYGENERKEDIERAIKQAGMAMQVAILAATEVGLATCWMAAVNHDRIEQTEVLPDGARLIAMSPLGIPPRRRGLSWDNISYHLISKRRKPLEAIFMQEVWSNE